MPHKTLHIKAPVAPITGYHKVISNLVQQLARRGHVVQLHPRGVEFEYGARSAGTLEQFITLQKCPKEALSIDSFLEPTDTTARFTMWESTGTTEKTLAAHRDCNLFIVPCKWNQEYFRTMSLKPVRHVPLGVDPRKYFWYPQYFHGKFVFGVAGRMKGFSARKNLFAAAAWFTQAFPSETNVELQIKGFPDDADLPDTHPFDRRIKIIKRAFSEAEWINWLAGINVLINTSWGEGWGLCQNEAMAMGRPVIMPNFGGLAEFFTPAGCYEVGYVLDDVGSVYEYRGQICRQSSLDTVAAMQYAYDNPNDVVRRGLAAADHCKQFTWERSAIALEKVLREFSLL